MRSEEIDFQRFDASASPLSRGWRRAVAALTAGSALLALADGAGVLAGRVVPDGARAVAPWRARSWIADGAALEQTALIASGLSLAPLDGAGWLALARSDLRSNAPREAIARGLKALALAFDTAPHAASLSRTRLALAVIGPQDQTLALAVGRDLRSLFGAAKAPQLLMNDLYALSGAEGRKLLEALPVKDVTVPKPAPQTSGGAVPQAPSRATAKTKPAAAKPGQ